MFLEDEGEQLIFYLTFRTKSPSLNYRQFLAAVFIDIRGAFVSVHIPTILCYL